MAKTRKRKNDSSFPNTTDSEENSQVKIKRNQNEETDENDSVTFTVNTETLSDADEFEEDVSEVDVSNHFDQGHETNTQDFDLFLDNTPPPSQPAPSHATTTTCTNSQSVTSGICHSGKSSQIVKDMPGPPENAINIAVASRALFSLDEESDVYDRQGLVEYIKYHTEREHIPMETGPAFPFIQALKHVNSCVRKINESEENIFNIILMSHNHAHMGVRLIRSIEYHDLNIQRMCLTGGSNPVDYLKAYNVKLYLTSYPEEVEMALDKGFAAATMLEQKITDPVRDQLRIAFDLDAVLFSPDCDDFYHKEGLEAYVEHEQRHADQPIGEGPLKEFATALGRMQQTLSASTETSPLRTYIVTARSACVGERALKTLRSWGLEIDELHFLSGASKGPILAAIKPHIFFDDAHVNIAHAQAVGTPAAHVKRSNVAGGAIIPCNPKIAKKMSFMDDEKK